MLSRPVPKSSKLGYLGLIPIIVIGAILLPMGSNSIAGAANTQKNSREHSETNTIVPGLRVGDYTLDMSKDEVLKKLGEPEAIQLGKDDVDVVRRGEERYSLKNLPTHYIFSFGDLSFWFEDDSAEVVISVRSPLYKLSNGLGVGDSEQKIKQAFGDDFQLEKVLGKDFRCYHAKGLGFEIDKKNQTVAEIVVYKPEGDHSDSDTPEQEEQSKHTIVPGLRVGDYTLGMSKDEVEVLNKSGQPEGMYFVMDDGVVKEISVYSPLYKFTNGLGVGDSEENIKQAFGPDFRFEEFDTKDLLTYKDKGLQFEIHKQNRTVREITITQKISRVKSIESVNEFDDVRSKDLSKLDLSSRKGLIATLQFNQETVWPEQTKMPTGSDPQKILTDSMNPGLGVRELHQQGITGKGVNVAIIDQPLLPDHPEYDGKIVAYHDTGCGRSKSSMHGPAVASLLVGTNCGTAPNARIYYAAAPSWKRDASFYAKGLDWIIEQNEKLPEADKIRVVSVSASPNQSSWANRRMWDRACARAEADGIMVLDCTDSHRGFLNRGWYNPEDPESVSKFNFGPPPKKEFRVDPTEMSIYVPSSCRTTAQHYDYHGRNSYIYWGWGRGGLSWAIPYCAGVLAMGWQIRPELTPAQMKEMLFASAYVHKSGAKIINPTAFIDLVRNQSDNQRVQTPPQTDSETYTIVPGLRIGNYTLDMSKDDVLRKLGEPEAVQLGDDEVNVVRRGEERYNLNNLPRRHILYFDNISFWMSGDSIEAISVHSPLYKLSNGLGVGDSEQKIKQAFGEDFHLEKVLGKDFLCYDAKGLAFEIHKKNQTVAEIVVYEPEGNHRDDDAPEQKEHLKHTIVPGVRVGNYTLDMSKDDVLKELGEPEAIQLGLEDVDVVRRGEERYSLNNLPRHYILYFGNISFWFEDDSAEVMISVHSPLYKLSNGLGVGDSEQKIKQAFGEDFQLEEVLGKEFLCYHPKGLGFEIHKKNQTVAEIVVYKPEGDRGDSDARHQQEQSEHTKLVRQAAADGRLSFKLTTPDEFKAIAGQPTREWTESNGEVIWMKYPGMRVNFFGKPDVEIPHTLNGISCEGREIDIGQNRQIVLRNEEDLHKLGSFWGFSNIDLSRLDLSQQGDLLDRTSFDSLTVWPPSDRLPLGFDPAKRLEWGKNPGLGVRSLHREGITGKDVGIAIIDQPLLRDHVEYGDRIKSYHAIEVEGVDIQMHGPPVCSIAVGKTCGVAPEASLHYYAVPPWKWGENRPWARTVEQIVERNRQLSPSEKVRVISISLGAFSGRDYYDQWKSAVEKAHQNGILVVTCDPYFLRYVTLERLVGTDPDDPNNYTFDSGVNALYVPASNRSMASHRGIDVYTFDTRGGNSWTVPYLAGLAAMAFQIHPEISPDRIVTLFQETATQTKQGRVINPRGFIEAVKRIKAQGL